MNGVNLIPQRVRTQRARAARTRAWGALSLAYAVLVGSGCVLASVNEHPAQETRAEIDDLRARAAFLAEKGAAAQIDAATLDRQIAAVREVAIHPDWSILLRHLASVRGPGVVLDALTLSPVLPGASARPATNQAASAGAPLLRPRPVGYTLMISGTALGQSAVSDFVLRLEDAHVFEKVTLLQSSVKDAKQAAAAATAPIDQVAFTLQCDMLDSATAALAGTPATAAPTPKPAAGSTP
ncbi:hypothetical protein BH11PLA1_BH11PLA1_12200 [soil metagenome]